MKVPHRLQFDAAAVKRQLGIAVASWDAFMVRMKALSERKVSDAAADSLTESPVLNQWSVWKLTWICIRTPPGEDMSLRGSIKRVALFGPSSHVARWTERAL